MNIDASSAHSASLRVPDATEAAKLVGASRRMFARTLSCWAVDVLKIRHANLHAMTWPGAATRPFTFAAPPAAIHHRRRKAA